MSGIPFVDDIHPLSMMIVGSLCAGFPESWEWVVKFRSVPVNMNVDDGTREGAAHV